MVKWNVYKVTNILNGKYYIGIHKTVDSNDNYLGSGIAIKNAVKKYGQENFTKEVLYSDLSSKEASKKEKELVTEEVVNDPNCYNMVVGGKGNWDFVNRLYQTGQLENAMKTPKSVKKCIDAANITREKDPEKYRQIAIKNLEKATEAIKNTPRSNEWCQNISAANKGKPSPLKDKPISKTHLENIKKSWTDERKKQQSDRMKERVLNGFDMGVLTRGKKLTDETKKRQSAGAKLRWEKHKQSGVKFTCPYCGKESSSWANMTRWHFDNCKHRIK